MTEIIRKSMKSRLIITTIVIGLFFCYLFDFVAPKSFLASHYLSFRSAIFQGPFGIEHIAIFLILSFTGLIVFLIPSYFGLMLSYAFGGTSLIAPFLFPVVSVLIPAKDHEKEIGKTLDCLLQSDYPKDKMDIVVVTSGSTDRTKDICEEYASKGPIRVIDKPLKRKGKPAALNLGLASAKGELIAVYDADTIVRPETIRNLVAPFIDPDVSAVTGPVQVLNEHENKLTKGAALEETWYAGAGLLFEIRERLDQEINLMGRNYCIRKDLLKSLGGFEETTLTEDFSLMFKLKAQEKRIVFSPKAVAADLVPSKWDAFSRQRLRWSAGWNDENKKFMAQAKNKGKAARSLINFLIQGNYIMFTFFAIIIAAVFGLLGDYFIVAASLLTIIFTLAMTVVAVHRYGNKHYSLLAYIPVFIFLTLFMFANAFVKPKKGLEWEKTPTT